MHSFNWNEKKDETKKKQAKQKGLITFDWYIGYHEIIIGHLYNISESLFNRLQHQRNLK